MDKHVGIAGEELDVEALRQLGITSVVIWKNKPCPGEYSNVRVECLVRGKSEARSLEARLNQVDDGYSQYVAVHLDEMYSGLRMA